MRPSRVMRGASIALVCAAAVALGAHTSAAQSATLRGDIVATDEDPKGVVILVNLGTADGVAVGWTGSIDGLKGSGFEIRSVSKHVSRALVALPMDVVLGSSLEVLLSP
jgi:hypothetical protein